MAPTYCVVKLFQKATHERLKRTLYGESLKPESSPQTKVNVNKCRICLKEGNTPIFNDDGSSEIARAIRIFANITVNKDDGYPKHICDACQRLLQGAILFRKIAKKSNKILKATVVTQQDFEEQNYETEEYVENNSKKKKLSIFKNYFVPIITEDQDNKSHKETAGNSHKQRKTVNKVQCQICYKVITKSYYMEHYSLHEIAPVKHVCDVCGKGFRLKSAYRVHLSTHRTEFAYKCHLCPYRGRYSGLLNTHMRTHIADYKYQCTECPAKFIYKCNLNKHSLRHKEPMFQCGDCKRRFHTRPLLDRHHEVEHLGIKNHMCHLCGKAFGYKRGVTRHQLEVHKRKKKLNGRTPAYLQVEHYNEEALE